jgi:hypothetical protein
MVSFPQASPPKPCAHLSPPPNASHPSWSCSKAVFKPVWHVPVSSVQWINSWWWAEELPETCRVSCRSKFGKLVHLVCFIIRKFVTMHGHMNVKNPVSLHSGYGKGAWQGNRWPCNRLRGPKPIFYLWVISKLHKTSKGTDK